MIIILFAELDTVHADPLGGHVHHLFEGKCTLRPAGCPVGPGSTGVGAHAVFNLVRFADVVDAIVVGTGTAGSRSRSSPTANPGTEDFAILADTHLHLLNRIGAVAGTQLLLGTVEHHVNRDPCFLRQQSSQNSFASRAELGAKATADILRQYLALLRLHPTPITGHLVAETEGRLARCPEDQSAIFPGAHPSMGFQRSVGLDLRAELTFHSDVRLVDDLFHRRFLASQSRISITAAPAPHTRADAGNILLTSASHLGGSLLAGILDGDAVGLDVVLDLDGAQGRLRLRFCLCCNSGDLRTGVAGTFILEDIGNLEHRLDPGHATRLVGIDGNDVRIGMGAAQNLAVDHSGWLLVVGILGGSGHLGCRIHPWKRIAYQVQAILRLPRLDVVILDAHRQLPELTSESDLDRDLLCHHLPPVREACSTASMMFW